jgi:hypothetical protein
MHFEKAATLSYAITLCSEPHFEVLACFPISFAAGSSLFEHHGRARFFRIAEMSRRHLAFQAGPLCLNFNSN